MPKSEKPSRGFGIASCSDSSPTVAKTGVVFGDTGAGLAVCAATQIEHEAASVRFGWLCVDSAAAVHSISDRQTHAEHRISNRIGFPASNLDSFQGITVICYMAMPGKLL
jgi:hypothetical protein